MRFIFIAMSLLYSSSSFAVSISDVATFNDKIRFQTEVFITSLDGKVLKKAAGGWSEIRVTKNFDKYPPAIIIEEQPEMKKLFAEVTVHVKENLEVAVEMHQWGKLDFSKSHEPKFSESIKQETQPIVNFGSLQFVIPDSPQQQYVIRVTPILSREPMPEQMNYLPMAVTDVLVVENTGKIWLQSASADGEVVRLSGRYGSIFLSFAPFAGSKAMGSAHDSEIELRTPEKTIIKIRSAKAIIGAGYSAIVHARIEPSMKLPGGGISSMGKDQVEKSLKEF